jgi:hypothetical protein
MRVRLPSTPPKFCRKNGIVMVYLLGHLVEISLDRVCTRSGDDHVKLKQEARKDRQRLQFDTEDSFVLCLRCGRAIPLRV